MSTGKRPPRFYLHSCTKLNEIKKTQDKFVHYQDDVRIRLKLKDLSPGEYPAQTLSSLTPETNIG